MVGSLFEMYCPNTWEINSTKLFSPTQMSYCSSLPHFMTFITAASNGQATILHPWLFHVTARTCRRWPLVHGPLRARALGARAVKKNSHDNLQFSSTEHSQSKMVCCQMPSKAAREEQPALQRA